MKTMERLCKRFERVNPGYTAELDKLESYSGYYVVYISEDACGTTGRYIFKTCSEFSDWANGVALD